MSEYIAHSSGSKEFAWTEECERAFQDLKTYLGHASLLAKPLTGERLFAYLAVSEHAMSLVLVKDAARVQVPVYYVSKRLLNAELRYPELERLALALVTSTKKLRHYFLAHPVFVLTYHLMK